jgi:hypothetical protein
MDSSLMMLSKLYLNKWMIMARISFFLVRELKNDRRMPVRALAELNIF